jgi:two-component system, NarL family, sensor kinase
VDRAMYGERGDPFAAVSRLTARLQAATAPGDALAGVAEAVASSLRLPYVAVETTTGVVAAHGTPTGAHLHVVPLSHQGEDVGRLVVEGRDGKLPTARDLALLGDLARPAGAAVHAAGLADALRASRRRLIEAREEERRRLRRDLHDGLGPALAAIVLKLDAVGRAAPEARELLAEVRTEARSAIEDIRRLVDDLRPPALDEVGLVNAVRQRAASLSRASAESLVVEVDGPSSPELAAAVEVAAYRIATEAVTNVVRHAGASRCVVTVSVNGALELTVADNGRRPWDSGRVGVGWSSMRDRAAELGGTCEISRRAEGGTLVRAVLPLHPTIQVATGSSRPVTQ